MVLGVRSIFLCLNTQKTNQWCDGLGASDLLSSWLQAIWEWLIRRAGPTPELVEVQSWAPTLTFSPAWGLRRWFCLCGAVDSSCLWFFLAFHFESRTHCWRAGKHIVVIYLILQNVFSSLKSCVVPIFRPTSEPVCDKLGARPEMCCKPRKLRPCLLLSWHSLTFITNRVQSRSHIVSGRPLFFFPGLQDASGSDMWRLIQVTFS